MIAEKLNAEMADYISNRLAKLQDEKKNNPWRRYGSGIDLDEMELLTRLDTLNSGGKWMVCTTTPPENRDWQMDIDLDLHIFWTDKSNDNEAIVEFRGPELNVKKALELWNQSRYSCWLDYIEEN